MADKEGVCAYCKQTFPIRLLRFTRNTAGVFVYLCLGCRTLKKEAEKALDA